MERAYLIPHVLDSAQLLEYESLCLPCLEGEQQRRKSHRVSVSFFVCCQQTDLVRIQAKARNLSTEGIAIETNDPISKDEKLGMEFFVPSSRNPFRVVGEVMWLQFHGETNGRQETLFIAGVRFLDIEDSLRRAIEHYLLKASE